MNKKTIPLNRDPVYRDLQKELRKRIHQGHWRKGTLIPSRRALADEFQVSVPTVQKAVADMVAEGMLRVQAKRGTYVFGDPEIDDLLKRDEEPTFRTFDDTATFGEIGGHVVLAAEISPGSSSLFASGWPFIIIHEAEYALAKYGIQSRFANRYDAHRKLGGTENSNALENAASSRAFLEAILAEKPVAVVLHESVILASDRDLLRQVFQSGIPTIVIGSENYGLEFVSVVYDSKNAGYQAAKHLIAQGCQRLLFFSAYQANWVEMRVAGVRLAMEAAGVPLSGLQAAIAPRNVEMVIQEVPDLHPHVSSSYNYAREILAKGLDVDGVIVSNDDAAFGFIRAASELGYQMRVDYTIVGFDDGPMAQSIGLTTMHPPCASMGREAARAIARILHGQDDIDSVVLKSRLIVRSTSTRLPAEE